MLPPEVSTILQALVERFGESAGTLAFNTLASGCRLDPALLRRVFAGIAPHLASLDQAGLSGVTVSLFADGFIDDVRSVSEMNDTLVARLVSDLVVFRCHRPSIPPPPDLPVKMIYEQDRVNARQLAGRLRAGLAERGCPILGLDTGSAAELYVGMFSLACRGTGDRRAVAGLLDLFEARMSGDGEEQAHFPVLCALVRYFIAARAVPAERVLSFLRAALADRGLPSKDLLFILYDFYHDDRYRGRQLTVLLALTLTCIRAFYPQRRHLVARVLGLQKAFLRISRSPGSRYVKTIFDTFVTNPHLDLTPWVEEGARIIRIHGESSDAARAYFERESDLSRRVWRHVDSGIHFADVAPRLQNVINALAERPVMLRPGGAADKAEMGAEYYTDGSAVFVPSYVKYVENRDDNYMVLLHSVAHECAHIEFSSFLEDDTRFRASAREIDALFPGQYGKSRAAVEKFVQNARTSLTTQGYRNVRLAEERMPLIARLLFHVPFPLLLRQLWNMAEDARVNTLLYAKYRGFARERERVDAIDFLDVPDVTDMEPLNALVSSLFARTWYGKVKGTPSTACATALAEASAVVDAFRARTDTDTYDSIVTGARILAVIDAFIRTTCPELLRKIPSFDTLEFSSLGIDLPSRNAILPLELEWYREESGAGATEAPDSTRADGDVRSRALQAIREDMGKAPGQFDAPRLAQWRSYPEWHRDRSCYLEDHCVLFEQPPAAGGAGVDLEGMNPGFVDATRRAFMALKPQGVSETRGMDDGHEIDFDRCVDCLLDLSAGHQMESDYYIFRERRERSVASALVLDMSPSTRQLVDDDLSIFDHQKYAAYVMAEALASAGDRFGIYSCYDFGPPATMFFSLKGLDEPWSMRHRQALRGFQPAEYGWSRFSVGLRHLVARMREEPERTKIIFFITDGVPAYYEGTSGKTGKSKEYMIDGRIMKSTTPVDVQEIYTKGQGYVQADLRKVREEATLAGVHLFFITIDSAAVQFMEETFGASCLYVPDVAQLPRKLLEVFRGLTT